MTFFLSPKNTYCRKIPTGPLETELWLGPGKENKTSISGWSPLDGTIEFKIEADVNFYAGFDKL